MTIGFADVRTTLGRDEKNYVGMSKKLKNRSKRTSIQPKSDVVRTIVKGTPRRIFNLSRKITLKQHYNYEQQQK